MKVEIYTSIDGDPMVTIEGEDGDTPEQVAEAYRRAKDTLNKKEDTNDR